MSTVTLSHCTWQKHDALLKQAWNEYGPKHASLYRFDDAFEVTTQNHNKIVLTIPPTSNALIFGSLRAATQTMYIHPELRAAVKHARTSPNHSETALEGLFSHAAPQIPASSKIFTQRFTDDLLQELDHLADSGIPQRRPNGMNRYGTILGDIGLATMMQGMHAYEHDALLPST